MKQNDRSGEYGCNYGRSNLCPTENNVILGPGVSYLPATVPTHRRLVSFAGDERVGFSSQKSLDRSQSASGNGANVLNCQVGSWLYGQTAWRELAENHERISRAHVPLPVTGRIILLPPFLLVSSVSSRPSRLAHLLYSDPFSFPRLFAIRTYNRSQAHTDVNFVVEPTRKILMILSSGNKNNRIFREEWLISIGIWCNREVFR